MKKQTSKKISPKSSVKPEPKKKSMKNIKIVFMGTSFLSQEILRSLNEKQAQIKLVITQPDKLSGRKKQINFSPVKKYCLAKNLKYIQPQKLEEKVLEKIKKINPDIILVASYGLIIPEIFFDKIKIPFVNIHPSLLPKLRGASPIQTALLEGLNETGITVMKMDAGMDSGDIIFQKKITVHPEEKHPELEQRIIKETNKFLPGIIEDYLNEKIKTHPQDHSKATFTKIIKKKDGQINWDSSAKDIHNKFRAYYLWPQTYTFWKTSKGIKKITLVDISFDEKKEISSKHKIGQVFKDENQIKIKTVKGNLVLKKIKIEGKPETFIDNFVNGYPDFINSILI